MADTPAHCSECSVNTVRLIAAAICKIHTAVLSLVGTVVGLLLLIAHRLLKEPLRTYLCELEVKMKSAFIVEDTSKPENRTFYQDEILPSLPLPALEETASKYLDSCKPVLDDEEYGRTVNIVTDFLATDGKRLHNQLERKSKECRNWLDDWWLDGYLVYRGPAAALNFTAAPNFSYWPFNDHIESFALQLHLVMDFWKILRDEKLRQQSNAKGNPFSMFQFKSLFNTCRIPYPEKDELLANFKTKYEGDCPSHIIIFYNKKIYKLQGICQKTGKVFSPSQFYSMILPIMQNRGAGPGIAFLTELKRDDWAAARSHLINLSPQNREALHEIETACFCASITDKVTEDFVSLFRHGMFGSSGFRWMDKFNIICCKDNKFVIHADHTPLDGMVVLTMLSYFEEYLQNMKRFGVNDMCSNDVPPNVGAVELSFQIDSEIENWIREGSQVSKELNDKSELEFLHFTEFGKSDIKKTGKIHPSAFAQICLQYAYMLMHGKPAATYETATTRKFYKGRTETLRTCTNESVRFCKAMIDDQPNKRELLVTACQAYTKLMEECKLARGCDRHLLGLSTIASENNETMPTIFTDSAFTKSGGGGNFLLSTSFVGSSSASGGVLPFRSDGYGSFYGIRNRSMQFVITAYRDGPYTSASALKAYLQKSLIDCYNLLSKSSHL